MSILSRLLQPKTTKGDDVNYLLDGKPITDDYIVLCKFNGKWKVLTTSRTMKELIENITEIWFDGKRKVVSKK